MDSLEPLAALLRKFFERRNPDLFNGIRHDRASIAEKLSAMGLLQSGSFVGGVTDVYVAGFEKFARGLMADTFDLVKRSGLAIDGQLAGWMTAQLDPLFATAANNVCREANGSGVLGRELQESVQRALDRSLAAIRRDLQIELDIALVTKGAVQPVDEALRDPLVSLLNRRALESEFHRLTNEGNDPLCFALIDVDHFKEVNDKEGGHAIGDEALKSIADAAAACTKGKGCAFRFGGDEFVLLLPNHTLQEGLAVAERFRREVNATPRTSQQLTLSVSVGVAHWPDHGRDFADIYKSADEALYDAKARRRNIVRYFGEPEPPTVAPREPERKQAEPSELSDQEQLKIRQDYFRSGAARCPRDEAVLDVTDNTSYGQSRNSLLVVCPFCGLSAAVE